MKKQIKELERQLNSLRKKNEVDLLIIQNYLLIKK